MVGLCHNLGVKVGEFYIGINKEKSAINYKSSSKKDWDRKAHTFVRTLGSIYKLKFVKIFILVGRGYSGGYFFHRNK